VPRRDGVMRHARWQNLFPHLSCVKRTATESAYYFHFSKFEDRGGHG
jgi:hypothetical protein